MRKVIFILLTLLSVMLLTSGAFGQVPQVMNYQGYLTDATGAPVPDGNYNLIFTIYDAESDGIVLWTETNSTVLVSKGLFNVILGSVVPINLPFDKPYWLGVKVGTEPELLPRMRLTTAAYSFRAGDANSVNGISASNVPAANNLFPLGADAKFPAAVLPPGQLPGAHATTHNEGGSDAITVTSALIQDGTVATTDLAENSATATKIADNAVTATKIQPDVVSSVDGVANDGGNIDLIPQNAITLAPNNTAKTITVGENHSVRTDNPHQTTAAQVGAPVSLEGVNNPGGNIDLVPGTNISISANNVAKTVTISATGGVGGDITAVAAGTGLAGGGTSGDVTLSIDNAGVGTIQLANNAVSTAKIQDQAVTQAKLAPDVTLPLGGSAGGDLTGTYPNPTIATGVVNTTKIADNAISTVKIQNQAITQSKLAPDATLPPSGSAGGDFTGTYPNPTIAAGVVNTTKIADGTIVDADISATANIAPTKIAGTVLTASSDYGRSGVATDLYEGTTKMTDKYVNEGQINSVTNAMLVDNAVTSAKIADGSIQQTDLAFASGDITAVNAGTGLNGGGTSGAVTLNVNVPLSLSGSAADPNAIINGTNSGTGFGVAGTKGGNTGRLGTVYEGVFGGSTDGLGLHGRSTNSHGVWGEAFASGGFGVHGTNGTNEGRLGTIYEGVFGASTDNWGVHGRSTNSDGVWGEAFANGFGVRGTNGNNEGRLGTINEGVFGISTDKTGVNGRSTNGYGLYGFSGGNVGVVGECSTGKGVRGSSDSGTGVSGNSTSGTGVSGASSSSDGVRGESGGSDKSGVYGVNSNSVGYGVFGRNTYSGDFGYLGASGLAVYGRSSGSGIAVYGDGGYWAGYFNGDVSVNGTLYKSGGSFKIDHPLDPEHKYLYHSFVESPDMMNIYNGNVTTDANGEVVVELPEWFEALNRDFRYQLTVIGSGDTWAHARIYRKIENNSFVIQTSIPHTEVSWQVTGIRKDAFANAHRIPVEEEKPAAEQGYYLHPDLYGQPEERSIEWASHPEMMKRMKVEREKLQTSDK